MEYLLCAYLTPLIGFHFLRWRLNRRCKENDVHPELVMELYNVSTADLISVTPGINYVLFILMLLDYKRLHMEIERQAEAKRTSWAEEFANAARRNSRPRPENNLQGHLTMRILDGDRVITEQRLQAGSNYSNDIRFRPVSNPPVNNPQQINTSGENIMDEISRL